MSREYFLRDYESAALRGYCSSVGRGFRAHERLCRLQGLRVWFMDLLLG